MNYSKHKINHEWICLIANYSVDISIRKKINNEGLGL